MVSSENRAADRVRWEAIDGDRSQASLFATPPDRVRHPEFRDLEFIHVRAKSLINEVPAAASLPFRHTINVYRGCSHACSYCMAGETPVLLASGRTKRLADIRPGDRVYGTERRGIYRRYVITEVVDHWSTVKPAYRIALEDGTELIASGDHRFLSDRGWKHVTGTEQGTRRRPHLTLNNELMGVGGFASPPKESPDYQDGYLAGMIRGDGHLGSYSYERPGRNRDDHYRFRLALVDGEALDRTRRYLRGYALDFESFLFQGADATHAEMHAVRTGVRDVVEFLGDLIAWPACPTDDWQKGFLAGIFDAEGSCTSAVRIHNTDPEILSRAARMLEHFGFDAAIEPPRPNRCGAVRLTGGLRERLRFFHTVDPAITRKRSFDGLAIKSDAPLGVESIEPLGLEMPMYDITTGTGDFIANGVVSHNCFARPTHEYLNLDAGRDFESVIVVKVNAVELLRHELHPSRWAGDHIAMGTNTDPYQRCEGRYGLTRGVIEALAERRNPFSVLTKSALVLRDLDLLREANRHADISVSFSVGTLDTDVWRSTEPGTPHPKRRIEAVAALRDAGIASGVLIAPIIPGVSDSREQLTQVVRAAVDAGATSITPIVLHLRPGVKEQFLPWLAEERPDLLPVYERLYQGSYAPKPERQRITRTVRDLVAAHGGPSAGRSHRDIRSQASDNAPMGRQRAADEDTAGEQLNLGI